MLTLTTKIICAALASSALVAVVSDSGFQEALRQVPALTVLVGLVLMTFRHLQTEGDQNRKVNEKMAVAIDDLRKAIESRR